MLKLGTQTASLVNHLHSRATLGQPRPEVGMGATELLWTDRHACTVVHVEELTGKRYRYLVAVTRDTATRTDSLGMSDCQSYSYTSNPDGYRTWWASHPETGQWTSVRRNEAGRLVKGGGGGFMLGKRDEHHDFSF